MIKETGGGTHWGQRPYPCVALHRDGQPHVPVPHPALGHPACAQIFVRIFLFYLSAFFYFLFFIFPSQAPALAGAGAGWSKER